MKKGFTLAEVLITLAIIGIVAALTIPSLANGYQKRVLTSQLQKAYAELSQAGAMVMADEMGEDFKSSKALREEEFVGKYVKSAGSASFADTYGAYGSGHENFSTSKSELFNSGDHYSCGKLKTGASFCVCYDSNSQMNIGSGWLDTNSDKGPNLIGRDMFAIGFGKDGTIGDYDNYLRSIVQADWDIDKANTGAGTHQYR